MTATPIPRTLAMTAYADLDVSVIDELPPGRTPIKTVVLPDARRSEVVERIDGGVPGGTTGVLGLPADRRVRRSCVTKPPKRRQPPLAAALPDVRVGLVHGRMPGRQKDAVMTAFKHGKLDLLVATTVIEVGVDVPNATLMVIENAERMGLAQLHQLRGRVGRGSVESTCVLLYQAAAHADRARAARRAARDERRLRGVAARPGAARTGRAARHAPDRA